MAHSELGIGITDGALAHSITVPLGRGGKYGQLDVMISDFQPHVMEHVFVYGLRQLLNDAIAQKVDEDGNTIPDDQLVAKAQKRLDTLYSGELRVRTAGEPADPVERELRSLAKAAVKAFVEKTPEWKDVPKGTKGDERYDVALTQRGSGTLEDAIAKVIAGKPALRKRAEQIVRDRAIDVGDVAI